MFVTILEGNDLLARNGLGVPKALCPKMVIATTFDVLERFFWFCCGLGTCPIQKTSCILVEKFWYSKPFVTFLSEGILGIPLWNVIGTLDVGPVFPQGVRGGSLVCKCMGLKRHYQTYGIKENVFPMIFTLSLRL